MDMKSLIVESVLSERVISIGFNASQEKFRDQYREQIYELFRSAYADIGGYGGIASGSDRERETIYGDINELLIKAIARSGRITAVSLYKDRYGRKLVATAAERSDQGKADWKKLTFEDHTMKRSWAEVSGAVQHLQTKMGVPKILASEVSELIGKKIEKSSTDPHEYSRKIGDDFHTKVAMGHPKRP